MYIRKFIITMISSIIALIIAFVLIYQGVMKTRIERNLKVDDEGIERLARVSDEKIQLYKEGQWNDLVIKGVQINSFTPGESRNRSSIKKEEMLNWLEQIQELNANVITIPTIQSPSFYNAIYDYNLKAEEPIYIIHEIPLEERAILKHYDAYNKEILKPLKKDIKDTIDVVHGNGIVINNKRHNSGIYLKDISSYVLGYIIGTNTNPEIVSLTKINYPNINEFDGEYFKVEKGTSYEVFIGEILDFAASYEVDKYGQNSLLSYLISVETDPLIHENESNVTKNANINLENIEAKDKSSIFASYSFHPNKSDFLDFEEYDFMGKERGSKYFNYINKINKFHKMPVIVSDVGMSSSRGMSKVDIDEGFNRGNMNEVEQGEKLVKLLDYIYDAGSSGAVIYSWQDDWGKTTAFNLLEDYSDQSSSTYWHDVQASDESFGLMKFEPGEKESQIYIDGEFEDWNKINPLLDENGFMVKMYSDTSYLYIMIKKKELSLTEDRLYIGLDITPLSGSNRLDGKVEFDLPADYIIDFNGYNESRIIVQERYNAFNYLYKYYSNLIEKQDEIPKKDSEVFSAIYLLNRRSFYFKESNKIIEPVYYQTGKLTYGDGNPNSKEFNSLTDFNKEGDALEIRIPWMLLNVKNPLKKIAQDDFYREGMESQIYIKDIGLSAYYSSDDESFTSKSIRYKIPSYRNIKHHNRLKQSYSIIQDYWK